MDGKSVLTKQKYFLFGTCGILIFDYKPEKFRKLNLQLSLLISWISCICSYKKYTSVRNVFYLKDNFDCYFVFWINLSLGHGGGQRDMGQFG